MDSMDGLAALANIAASQEQSQPTTAGVQATLKARKWKDCMDLYPSPHDIAEALQDPGKESIIKQKGKNVVKHKFPKVAKLASRIYQNILNTYGPDGMTKNISRGKESLAKEIVLNRRHADINETHPFFHSYGKDGKVYLIANNPMHSGLDIVLQNFQDSIKQHAKKTNFCRTSFDALRLCGILLDNKYRDSVAMMMTNKKDRTRSDIPGDSNLHLFEKLSEEAFMNEDYNVPPLSEKFLNDLPEEETGNWDPNHPSIFENDRDAKWLLSTWMEYVKPKYKKYLDKWNKETGGGNGKPTAFIDFCEGNRWVAWIFLKDYDANFLLANNAGGRMPRHLNLESGFDDDVSSLDGSSSRKRSGREALLDSEISQLREQRNQITSCITRLLDVIETRKEFQETKKQATDHSSQSDDQDIDVDLCLGQVSKYSQEISNKSVLDTFSPESKEKYVNAMKKQRKEWLDKLEK